MKTIHAIPAILCSLAAAGLAVWLVAERQARFKLGQANEALRQQLSRLDEITAENERLSVSLSQPAQPRVSSSRTNGSLPAPPVTAAQELVRLRDEVKALRQQSKELEALREDTHQARVALESNRKPQGTGRPATTGSSATANGPQLEILKAEYWTGKTRLDVTDEIRDRIREDHLKAIASNNLKGDPEFGQVKRLTIEYRIAGVTMTNEFREGDVVIIPAE